MVVSDIYQEVKAIIGDCREEFVFELLSDSIEALANKGMWDPLVAYADFTTTGNLVTLPDWVEAPLRVNINKNPSFAKDRLFEFKQNTDGSILGDELGWSWADRGEVPVQVVPTTPAQIRATAANSVRVFGIDSDNKEVFDASGNLGYLATTSLAGPVFKEITAVKKEKTTGFVDLYSGTTLIASYEPREYSPLFRQIKLSKATQAVRMLFRRRTYRVASQTDWIPLNSGLAIKLMVQAVLRWRKGQELDVADGFQKQAQALLEEEQASRNAFIEIAGATEVLTDTNRTYLTRDAVIVGDIYDQASEIFGPISRQKLFDRITDSIELLTNKSNWDGLTGFLDICSVDWYKPAGCSFTCKESNEFTLPEFVDTVLKVNIGDIPSLPQNKWFEFHLNGPGSCNILGDWTWRDRGDYPTFRDINQASQIVAELDSAADNNTEIRIYGYDDQGRILMQDGKEGIVIPAIYGVPLPDPALPLVSRITRITKPETSGYVKVIALDPTSTDGVMLANMDPWMTEPRYRRIAIGVTTQTVRILFRKKTRRVQSMLDLIPLYSKMAIVMSMKAVKAYQDGQFDVAANAEAIALRLLEEEQNARNPQIDFPIEVDMTTAPGSIWNYR